jgi:hypothetical protein
MKVYKASEDEIDQRLALDKRKTKAAFCRGFESESEIPFGFYDQQDKIRDGLEKEFFEKFDDGVDRSNLVPWKGYISHTFFYFPAELICSERIIIELSSEILDDKLLGVILAYLEKASPQYCVIAAVFSGRNLTGQNYIGRFVINLEEIAVEESLVEVWSKQVQFMTIE